MSVIQLSGVSADSRVKRGQLDDKNTNAIAARGVRDGKFRYDELVGLKEDPGLRYRIGEYLKCGDRTEALIGLQSDWTGCVCLLHKTMPIEVQGGVGCELLPAGFHSAMKGLYGAEHRACVVEPGVRVRDKEVFIRVEFPGGVYRPVRSKYMAGRGAIPEALGAYYCYTRAFPDTVIIRIGRLLGPQPPVHRVLRWFLCLGRRDHMQVAVEALPDGRLHLREDKRGDGLSPMRFIELLMEQNPNAKMGFDAARANESVSDGSTACVEMQVVPSVGYVSRAERDRFGVFTAWCKKFAVDIPEVAMVDYCMATRQQSENAAYPDVVRRARMFEHYGDRTLAYVLSRHVMLTFGSAADVSAGEKAFANEKLARVVSDNVAGVASVLCVGTLLSGSKAVANLLEGMFGVLSAYCGYQAVRKVGVAVGIMPSVEAGVVRRPLVIDEPNVDDELVQMQAMLADYRLRGGNSGKLRERMAELLSFVHDENVVDVAGGSVASVSAVIGG